MQTMSRLRYDPEKLRNRSTTHDITLVFDVVPINHGYTR